MKNTLRDLNARIWGTNYAESVSSAVEGYGRPELLERQIILEVIPLDALVFAGHQTPWLNEDEFREKRCRFDEETNEWLVNYVRSMGAEGPFLQPIIIMATEDGVDLIDGLHRVSALLMYTNATHIAAWVIQEEGAS